MTPDELAIPEWAKIVLIIVGAVLLVFLLVHNKPEPFVLPEPKEPTPEPEIQETNELDQLNPDYGAYVWLAGKRYN